MIKYDMNKRKMLIVSRLSCAVGALVGHEIITLLHKPDHVFEQALTPPPQILYLDHPDGEIYEDPHNSQFAIAGAGGSHPTTITVPTGSLVVTGAAPLLPV